MIDQVLPLSIEDSHFKIFPVYPVKEIVPLLADAHKVAFPESVPATVTISTVILTALEYKAAQELFCTSALKEVVVARLL
jgi:hypothetical protein